MIWKCWCFCCMDLFGPQCIAKILTWSIKGEQLRANKLLQVLLLVSGGLNFFSYLIYCVKMFCQHLEIHRTPRNKTKPSQFLFASRSKLIEMREDAKTLQREKKMTEWRFSNVFYKCLFCLLSIKVRSEMIQLNYYFYFGYYCCIKLTCFSVISTSHWFTLITGWIRGCRSHMSLQPNYSLNREVIP